MTNGTDEKRVRSWGHRVCVWIACGMHSAHKLPSGTPGMVAGVNLVPTMLAVMATGV